MSPAPASKRAAPSDGTAAPGPFDGARALGAVRDECRRLAAEIGTESFGVFTVQPGAERRLEPRLTGKDPEGFLGAFLGQFDSEVARHVLASSAPFWWGEGAVPSHLLPWGVRGSFDGLPGPGIGFPCASSRGVCGAVLFWGGRIALGPEQCFDVHARLFAAFEVVAALRPKGLEALPRISKREIECLRLTAKGLTSEEIAEALGLSAHTANQHLGAATAKLDAVNRMQAVAKALRLGLID